MKKVVTFFCGLAALAFASPTISAEDVYIKIDHHNNNLQFAEGNAKYDELNDLLGNIDGLVLDLGEVDFSANEFKGAFVDLANGWQTDGYVVLSAGSDYSSSEAFVKIPIKEFYTYYLPRRFGQNFGKNVDNYSEAPTGVQHVYLSFENGSGNLFGVGFVEEAYTESDYYNSSSYTKPYDNIYINDGDNGKRILWPYENKDKYQDKFVVIEGKEFARSGGGNGDDSGKIDSDGSIGWTGNNLEMKSKSKVDFGSNKYNQILLEAKLSDYDAKVRLKRQLEIYIDEVTDGNRIGCIWYGMEAWNGQPYIPLVCNLEREVSGEHDVILKWGNDGGNNIMNVSFYEGNLYPVTQFPDDYLFPSNVDPITNEGLITLDFIIKDGNNRTDGVDAESKIFNDKWMCTILKTGQWESAGNVGYTNKGTILRITDDKGEELDFGNIEFRSIVAKYATGNDEYINSEDSNYKIYIDLENYGSVEWDREEEWNSETPIAQIPVQETSGWGNVLGSRGLLADPTILFGKHKLYIVLNRKDGANLHALYFEPKVKEEVEGTIDEIENGFTVTFDEDIDLTEDEEAVITVTAPADVDVTNLTPKVTPKDNVLTVELVDYPVGEYTVTIPAGFVNVGEDFINAAVKDQTIKIARTEVDGEVREIENGFTVAFDVDIQLANDEDLVISVVTDDEELDIEDLEPKVSALEGVLTVELEGYPVGEYTVTIPAGFILVGTENINAEIEETVVIEKEEVGGGEDEEQGGEEVEEPKDDDDTSAIDSLEISGNARFFNLTGNEISNPAPGQIVIMVVDGKASKVIVK
ncbi:MAG: hypothetical protein J1F38_01345 [Muribaculaceae bacterium]|nr:hypothetical protein [Muribaculaceae bacterium]